MPSCTSELQMHDSASNRLGEQMFSIDERNKITLTKGDTASFTLTIVDDDGKERELKEGDVLTFSIDNTEFSKEASDSVFTFVGSDTEDLEQGVYMYRIVLNTEGQNFTIFQDEFFELLGDGSQSEEEEEEEQEVTDEPQR